MAYIYLFLAIITETSAGVLMKSSEGLTKFWPTFFMILLYGISIAVASLAVRGFKDVSLVYALWSGLGLVLVTLIGHFLFGESITPLKILFIGFIIIGAIGLNTIANK